MEKGLYIINGFRYHISFEETCKTLKDAVISSWWMIEENTARPVQIVKDGEVIWDDGSLSELAEKHGIELPD